MPTVDEAGAAGEAFVRCSGGAEVELVTLAAGTHSWPNSRFAPAERMWSFLSRFVLE